MFLLYDVFFTGVFSLICSNNESLLLLSIYTTNKNVFVVKNLFYRKKRNVRHAARVLNELRRIYKGFGVFFFLFSISNTYRHLNRINLTTTLQSCHTYGRQCSTYLRILSIESFLLACFKYINLIKNRLQQQIE